MAFQPIPGPWPGPGPGPGLGPCRTPNPGSGRVPNQGPQGPNPGSPGCHPGSGRAPNPGPAGPSNQPFPDPPGPRPGPSWTPFPPTRVKTFGGVNRVWGRKCDTFSGSARHPKTCQKKCSEFRQNFDENVTHFLTRFGVSGGTLKPTLPDPQKMRIF